MSEDGEAEDGALRALRNDQAMMGFIEILSSDDESLDEYLKDADELVMSPLANFESNGNGIRRQHR